MTLTRSPIRRMGTAAHPQIEDDAVSVTQTDHTTDRAIQPVSMTLYDADFQEFSDAMGASFSRYGFAVVADHGLDEARITAAIDDAKAFFALPEEVKRQYHQPGTGGARGLTPFGVEAAKDAKTVDLKEFWHVGRELPEGHPYRRYMRDNLWPTEIEGFREHLYGMFEDLDALGAKVLSQYATLGQFDFVTVIEAESEEAMVRVSAEMGSRGTMSSETMGAVPTDRLDEIL